MHSLLRAGLGLGLVLGAAAASAADLRGHVTLTSVNGETSPVDLEDTVVFFSPDSPVRPRALGDQTMTMQGKSFSPHVLTVTEGTTVHFTNADPILHNVFSTSYPNDFDMGLYGHGGGKAKTFVSPGLVRVYCNVHHEMFAYILVLNTPYFTALRNDGSFDLRNLPNAPGTLTIYNPRSQPWKRHVTGGPQAPFELQLTMVQSGVPAHFNKLGKPYSNNPGSGY